MSDINYNKLPVIVCRQCLSIAIKCDDAIEPANEETSSDEYRYCMDCGSIETYKLSFNTWETRFEERYGLKFLELNNGKQEDNTED